jgi:hypothetical protein
MDPYLMKSCIPMSESKTQRSDCGGWGRGLGNNVSNTMRGVNAEAEAAVDRLDTDSRERAQRYADMRKSGAIRKNRKRRATFRIDDARVDGTGVIKAPENHPVVKLENGSCDVGLRNWQTHALNRLRGKR